MWKTSKVFGKVVEYVKDDRLMAHPICLDKRTGVAKGKVQDKSLTIPLFLHADGVEYQQRDSLLVWNWGGFLNAYSSLTSHFLIAGFPKSCTIHDKTWKPLMDWILWSFEALQDGVHPSYGPDNGPLPKGSVFEKLAGQPLTQRGFRLLHLVSARRSGDVLQHPVLAPLEQLLTLP